MIFFGRGDTTYSLLPQTSHDAESPIHCSEKQRRRAWLRGLGSFVLRRCRQLRKLLIGLLLAIFALLCFAAIFNPSYLRPAKYEIPQDERIFIAANIVDEDLIRGAWGDQLVELVELLGASRTFVSVYGGPTAALQDLDERLAKLDVPRSIVSEAEAPLDFHSLAHADTFTGPRVRRISFLAEVRNRALEPLHNPNSTDVYDKILFLNDVIYRPSDATRLLFGTNVREDTGKADYKAACAMDFINPFKYYDTYATRDFEGRSLGVPFFPWFSHTGEAISRRDVLAGKDAVRVRSCWGGMVAFDARYFQAHQNPQNSDNEAKKNDILPPQEPVKFRSFSEPGWEGSECCIIHADLQSIKLTHANISIPDKAELARHDDSINNGIFMNPYVRTSYEEKTFKWIKTVQRVERLFSIPHNFVNWISGTPRHQPRRLEIEGQSIHEQVWVWDQPQDNDPAVASLTAHNATGHFEWQDRIAGPAGYCSSRNLLVLKAGIPETGQKVWEKIVWPVPPEMPSS